MQFISIWKYPESSRNKTIFVIFEIVNTSFSFPLFPLLFAAVVSFSV